MCCPARRPERPRQDECSSYDIRIPGDPERSPRPFPSTLYWKLSTPGAELFFGSQLQAKLYDGTWGHIGPIDADAVALNPDPWRHYLHSENPLEALEHELGTGPVRDFRFDDGSIAPSPRAYCQQKAERFSKGHPGEQELRYYVAKALITLKPDAAPVAVI